MSEGFALGCDGGLHHVRVVAARLETDEHDDADLALAALGAAPSPCVALVAAWDLLLADRARLFEVALLIAASDEAATSRRDGARAMVAYEEGTGRNPVGHRAVELVAGLPSDVRQVLAATVLDRFVETWDEQELGLDERWRLADVVQLALARRGPLGGTRVVVDPPLHADGAEEVGFPAHRVPLDEIADLLGARS